MNIFSKNDKDVLLPAFTAAFSAMWCFASYELFRSSSESVFLSVYSATHKIYALSIVPLALFLLIWLYSSIIDRIGPLKTSVIYFVISALSMILFYYGCIKKISFFVFGVLVFKEAYIVILSEIYWSYINSILTLNQARRLNGYIAGFGACGSVAGGYLVVRIVKHFSTKKLFLISAVFLIFAAIFIYLAYLFKAPRFSYSKNSFFSSISEINKNSTLTVLFVAVFLSQIVSTFADINFTENLKKTIDSTQQRTSYLGSFWTAVNVFSFVFQFIITPFILKKINPVYILVAVPVVHIISSVYSFIYPGLFSASVVFLLFKSLDYSLYRASRETLYIPFDDDIRFKAKQIIDAFNYRFSKGIMSVILSVFSYFNINVFPFLIPSIAFVSAVWSFLMSRIRSVSEVK